jgi:hypothetical protein
MPKSVFERGSISNKKAEHGIWLLLKILILNNLCNHGYVHAYLNVDI